MLMWYNLQWNNRKGADIFQMGVACLHVAEIGDRTSAIEQAIQHFQHALEWVDHRSWPQLWGEIHQCLSEAYAQRQVGDPLNNAQQALKHLRAAQFVLPSLP